MNQHEDKEQVSHLAHRPTSDEPPKQNRILSDDPLSDLVDTQSVRKSKFTVRWENGGVVETHSFELATKKLYAISTCLGQESRTKIWNPIVQLSVGLRVWHPSQSYGVVELTTKVDPEPQRRQQQQRTLSRCTTGIKKKRRLDDAMDASIALLRQQSTLHASHSDHDLKRLAQESARAEGFVAGVECTAQELKTWAKTRAAIVGQTFTTGSAVINTGAAMGSAVIDAGATLGSAMIDAVGSVVGSAVIVPGATVGSAFIDTGAAAGKGTVDALAWAIFTATEKEQEEGEEEDEDEEEDVASLPLDGAPRSRLDLKVHSQTKRVRVRACRYMDAWQVEEMESLAKLPQSAVRHSSGR